MYQDAANPPCQAFFGNICDDAALPAKPPTTQQTEQAQKAQQAQRWGSIAQLAGQVQVASCSAVLHCLGKETVEQLLRKVSPAIGCRSAVHELPGMNSRQ